MSLARWGDSPCYQDLVSTFCDSILVDTECGSYSGDSLLLLKAGERIGLLSFGWGSCSGCDALQGALLYGNGDDADVDALRDDLARSVVWKDVAAEMLAYLEAKDWDATYHAGEGDHVVEFMAAARKALA